MARHWILAAGLTALTASALAAQIPAPSDAPAASAPVCIAVVMPAVQGIQGDPVRVAQTVQGLFASYLTGPSIRPLAIEARLPALALQEARDKRCDRILMAEVSRKRTQGNRLLGRIVGQAAGSAAWALPGGNVGAAMARGATAAAAQGAADVAFSTRAKDEMTLSYRLAPVASAGAVVGPRVEKRKARADGEDLLTPLVEAAAQGVVTAVGVK
jgi:hypothetical protein